jgi:hypothetical protein
MKLQRGLTWLVLFPWFLMLGLIITYGYKIGQYLLFPIKAMRFKTHKAPEEAFDAIIATGQFKVLWSNRTNSSGKGTRDRSGERVILSATLERKTFWRCNPGPLVIITVAAEDKGAVVVAKFGFVSLLLPAASIALLCSGAGGPIGAEAQLPLACMMVVFVLLTCFCLWREIRVGKRILSATFANRCIGE